MKNKLRNIFKKYFQNEIKKLENEINKSNEMKNEKARK